MAGLNPPAANGAPPLSSKPAPVLFLDFSISTPAIAATDNAVLNVPKFGPNDFTAYGGDGLGFDLNQWVLTKVELRFTATFMADIQVENDDAQNSVEFTYSLPLTSTFSYPNSGTEIVVPTIDSSSEGPLVLGAFDGSVDYDGASGYGAPVGEGADSAVLSSPLFQVAPPGAAAYTGTGTWAVNISSVVGSLTTTPSTLLKSGSLTPMMVGGVRVVYSYLQVPEPGTMITAAGLVAMLGVSRWRSTRKS
ncbi:MAG: choice-of-anchor E domain-containing protein [Gammaproteobacteria bacterium]|nr:choice-of-anchor E domain-containing protein [Gammaproteobacteria bacterium]